MNEHLYASGGSPGASGSASAETYTKRLGVMWESAAIGSLSCAATDSGFIGLQKEHKEGELANSHQDLAVFDHKLSPDIKASLLER